MSMEMWRIFVAYISEQEKILTILIFIFFITCFVLRKPKAHCNVYPFKQTPLHCEELYGNAYKLRYNLLSHSFRFKIISRMYDHFDEWEYRRKHGERDPFLVCDYKGERLVVVLSNFPPDPEFFKVKNDYTKAPS